MIWRLTSLPELQHLTQAQRAALLRTSIGSRFGMKMWSHNIVRGLASTLILGIATSVALNAIGVQPTGLLALVLFAMFWPIATVGLFQLSMAGIRREIRLYLSDMRTLGVKPPVCLQCGYAVEEQASHCPECGAAV